MQNNNFPNHDKCQLGVTSEENLNCSNHIVGVYYYLGWKLPQNADQIILILDV